MACMDQPDGTHSEALADSVAAYDAHVAAYTAANADAMGHEARRFVDEVVRHGTGRRGRRDRGAGPRVLDAGCGPGRDLARFAAAGLAPVGVDLNAAFCTQAAPFAPCVRTDLRVLPFAREVFAGVWACASLVHLDADGTSAALAELARVAAGGAPLFVSVKSEAAQGTGWADTAHGRRWFQGWTPRGLASAVEAAGFSVTETAVSGAFVDAWARRR
jgi:SAM-dependent methyltransferase